MASATAPRKSSSGSRTSQQAKAAPPKNQQEVIVIDPEKAKKLLKNLKRPPPVLLSDYDRSIVKSYAKPERKIRKQVPQLGEQENQSCPPLKVFSDNKREAELAQEYKKNLQNLVWVWLNT